MGFLILVTVVYVEVAKVETKFIIKDKYVEAYFLGFGKGTTLNRSEAYHYTSEEIINSLRLKKKCHVLIPVTK